MKLHPPNGITKLEKNNLMVPLFTECRITPRQNNSTSPDRDTSVDAIIGMGKQQEYRERTNIIYSRHQDDLCSLVIDGFHSEWVWSTNSRKSVTR